MNGCWLSEDIFREELPSSCKTRGTRVNQELLVFCSVWVMDNCNLNSVK